MAIAVIGLSLNEAAYAAEVVRAGLLSVDQGQLEAAAALGLSKSQNLPQNSIPAGTSDHRAVVRQSADRADQGHVAGLLRLAARPVRAGGEHGQHVPGRHHPAADGGDRLVPDPDDDPVGRPVLRRTGVLEGRAAHRAADAVPATQAVVQRQSGAGGPAGGRCDDRAEHRVGASRCQYRQRTQGIRIATRSWTAST